MAELDKKYEEFLRKWKPRLGLKDREVAQAYMRGEANDAAGYGKLRSAPGKTDLSVRVDGRGLDAVVDPPAIDDMIAEWQAQIEELKNPRDFSKNFIEEIIATNRHLDEGGDLVLSAVVWLVSENDQMIEFLKRGDVTLLCEFTYDNERRERRMHIELALSDLNG